jgi:hypothetical protein
VVREASRWAHAIETLLEILGASRFVVSFEFPVDLACTRWTTNMALYLAIRLH